MLKTTESILAGLAAERAEHVAAGRLAEVRRVDQAAIAHRTLARLRAERAEQLAGEHPAAAAALAGQIRYWLTHVDVDVDQPPAADEPPAGGEQASTAGEQPPVDDQAAIKAPRARR